MKIAFAVSGTRGDVQPAVVLAYELATRGHSVRVGVPPNLIGFATNCGLDAIELGYDTRAHIDEIAEARARAGRRPLQRMRVLAAMRDTGWSQMVRGVAQLADGADILVTGFTTEQIALAFAERHRIPLVSIHHAPIRANGRVGPLPAVGLGRAEAVIRMQWSAVDRLFGLLTRRRENALRDSLGCRPAKGTFARRILAHPGVELQAYDPIAAIVGDERWSSDSSVRRRPITGWIELPDGLRNRIGSDRADSDLGKWLSEGPAPLYFGFGSMPLRHPGETLQTMVTVARRLQRRALICVGSATPDSAFAQWADARDVAIVRSVDHRSLFPLCEVIIHHGGAGTTAEALRAGRPSVVCWYGSDQPFWGEVVSRSGAGRSFPVKQLDPENLESAVRAMMTASARDEAEKLAARIVSGPAAIADAVREIERVYGATYVDESVDIDREEGGATC